MLDNSTHSRADEPSILFVSDSPRRKALLEQLGLLEGVDFMMVQANACPRHEDEAGTFTLDAARARTVKTAREKIRHALMTAGALTDHSLDPQRTVVVGADSVVFWCDRLLKSLLPRVSEWASPHGIERGEGDAIQMLKELRGKTISVITGLVAVQADNLVSERSTSVVTRALVKNLRERDIEHCAAAGERSDEGLADVIHARGVVLIEKIEGSYSNLLGLPLAEFYELLHDDLFAGRVHFHSHPTHTSRQKPRDALIPGLSAVSVGDIACELVYGDGESGGHAETVSARTEIAAKVGRPVVGSAIDFAFAAQNAGFKHCSVLGLSGNAPGESIMHELHRQGIAVTLLRDQCREYGPAGVLCDPGVHDVFPSPGAAAHPMLNEQERAVISGADLFHISGHCLADINRRAAAWEMLRVAKQAGRITVLDVVAGMSGVISFDDLCARTRGGSEGKPLIDVLVSETPELLSLLGVTHAPREWESLAPFLTERVVPVLRRHFTAVFLRTPRYSHELIATPAGITTESLDCSLLPAPRPAGYGNRLTAAHLYEYMSPRVLIASRSPQRFALLCQLIAANKIEVRPAEHPEHHLPNETPQERVVRLAREKASVILEKRRFTGNIEVLIAADTEVVVPGDHGRMDIVAHPHDNDEAVAALRQLSGREHLVITGLAVVGADPGPVARGLKTISECISTLVRFKRLSEAEILEYVESGECIGRAGAYAIQGKGAVLVERIAGSYSNVVGLPLERLAEILDVEFRLPVRDMDVISNWRRPRRLKEALER